MKMVSLFLLSLSLFCCMPETEPASSPGTTSQQVLPDTARTSEQPLYCNAFVRTGAEQTALYIPLLTGQRVAVVGNPTSMIGTVHLVDSLQRSGINVVKVFSPEHGFRGTADAGEKVASGIDPVTGLPVISLYGSNKKPTVEQLKDVDVIVFDIQDVGARFYTYISTLHYMMQAAAENGKKLVLLDRPNPNGHYVDGPVLDPKFKSFVGMHEVPVVHGMTIGEYAKMVNGEGWLGNGLVCDLEIIPCEGWDHTLFYELPVAPSPNLRTMNAIYRYPGLCFFEGTVVSVGRGTDYPFEVIGHPDFTTDSAGGLFTFTPHPNEGSAHPVLEGKTCYGYLFSDADTDIRSYRSAAKLDLRYLLEFYQKLNKGASFFLSGNFINNLAGTDQLKAQILAGKTLEEIEASWQEDLRAFRETRKKYLLYKDFE